MVDYILYVNLLRDLAVEGGIPVTLDTDDLAGIKTHYYCTYHQPNSRKILNKVSIVKRVGRRMIKVGGMNTKMVHILRANLLRLKTYGTTLMVVVICTLISGLNIQMELGTT